MDSLYPVLSIFFAVVFALYKWSTRNLDYWKERNFPHIKAVPALGNFVGVFLGKINIAEQYREFYNQMKGARYFGILLGTHPAVILKDPDLIMRILVKDFRYFYNRGFHVPEKDFLGDNLFFMRNPKWRLLRSKIVSVFSSAKLKCSFEIIDKCTDDLIEYLNENNAEDEILPTRQVMADAMTDVVCKAILGIEMHSMKNPNMEHVEMQNKVFIPSLRAYTRNIVSFFSPHFLAKKVHNFSSRLDTYFTDITWKTIEHRKEENIRRNDLLQLLMEVYEQEKMLPVEERVLGREDVVSAVFIMLVAGYETSTSTSSLALHELAHNLELQNQVRKEIQKVVDECGGKIKYEDLNKLKLLEQVVSETLRLYPLANAIFRECMEDYNIPDSDHVLERGVFVHIPTLALHTDPAFWKDPEIFDPSRFSEQNASSITPGSYLPFGDGPRICIGKRFAWIQLKLLLIKVLLNYQVSPCEKTKRHYPLLKNSQLSVPEGVYWLKFTKLKQK